MVGNFVLIAVIFVTQVLGTSIYNSHSITYSFEEVSDEELITRIKSATSSLTSLFNEKEGIFLWNIQNPSNISRYGDFSDLTNSDEGLENLDVEIWMDCLAQDILLQYFLLKQNVNIALEFVGDQQEEYLFNREWIFMTEQIISWLFTNIATNDQLISILNLLSVNDDGFGEFWNYLIRPKYQNYLNEKISLLTDTLVLGSKILKAVDFMPYFSPYEKLRISLLTEIVSNWWNAINQYALSDPKFAVAGLGKSKIYSISTKWVGWKDFGKMATNETFIAADLYDVESVDFQNYLYTSPQLANLYISYIMKASIDTSYAWNYEDYPYEQITDPVLVSYIETITTNYAEHIEIVENEIVYVIEPGSEFCYTPLEQKFSGYSYYWSKYFIDSQDSEMDYHHYRYNLPMGITKLRSYQGAGDIRGLIDVYHLLSNAFVDDNTIQIAEHAAHNIIEEILNSQREDSSFAFSPYFGTSLNQDILAESLINDAEIIMSDNLPDGLNTFTGTITVLHFLLEASNALERYGVENNERLTLLKERVDQSLVSVGDSLLEKIEDATMGIPKQAIVGTNLLPLYGGEIFIAKPVKVTINSLSDNFIHGEVPSWIYSYNSYTDIGRSKLYQWDYLTQLKDIYLITNDMKYVEPMFKSLELFALDYQEDEQYQLTAICERQDAIARTFFTESFADQNVELQDTTGIFGNSIPYVYRSEVSPVTSAFASETPQRIIALILRILPFLQSILDGPINQVVIVGFISGLIITISVVYSKRPKYQ